jgi:MOSC domain-containing protein YiiM
MSGVLTAIYVSPAAGMLPQSMAHVRVLTGRGIEGDRYALGNGTFSGNAGQRDVTLIEAEALEQFAQGYGQSLDPAASRRNLLTRGVRLNELVGREFMVGEIRLRGLRLCEPCTHLARVTAAPVLPGLVHRGGLYAEVLCDGEWRVGDEIRVDLGEVTAT